jgi:hypothetical protein
VPAAGPPLGAGDCEARRAGPLGQPTNTVTSGAYLVAAGWLAARARHVAPAHRWRPLVAAAVSATAGLGSIAYHGPGGRVAHVLHDGSLLVQLGWLVVGSRTPLPDGHVTSVRHARAVAVAALGVGAVAYALGRTPAPTCRPRSRWQWHGLWHVAGAVAVAAWSEATDVRPHPRGVAPR